MPRYDTRSPRALPKWVSPPKAGPRGQPALRGRASGAQALTRARTPAWRRARLSASQPTSCSLPRAAPPGSETLVTPALDRSERTKEQQVAFKTFLLLNGQLRYNSFPLLRACGATASPPRPQSLRGVQGPRGAPHRSRRIELYKDAPITDFSRKPVESYSLSLCEMNRTVLCNTAPSSGTVGFLCPAPAAWKTVWGKIFQSIHILPTKNAGT